MTIREKIENMWVELLDRVRGSKMPIALSAHDWNIWHTSARKSHPFRHWLAENFLSKIPRLSCYPMKICVEVKAYISNRFVSKTHALVAKPQNIQRGKWCELGDRLLPCMFDSLVDFVETDMALCCGNLEEYGISKMKIELGNFRCAEAGIDHLIWEACIHADENYGVFPGEYNYNKPTHQAIKARWILNAYNWWKYEYPNREVAEESSGWNAYMTAFSQHNDTYGGTLPEELNTMREIAYTKLNNLVKHQKDEEEKWMIEFIQMRESIWT